MAKRLSWPATVGCEGGPLLAASAQDFARWPGALGTSREKSTLQFDGYTDELPPKFRPEGDVEEIVYGSHADAKKAMAELKDALCAKFPGVKVTEDETDLHFLLPDRREIAVQLGPASEYDASWRAHLDDETWTHIWGREQQFRAFFWELEGGCVVQIGVSAERDEIVFVQSWVDDEADEEKVRALVDAPHPDEEDGEGELVVPTGHAVIIWSPTSVLQLEGFDFDAMGWDGFEAKLRALAEQQTPVELETDMIAGLGTALMLKPGRWRARVGRHDPDDAEWSCRWCRLKWAAA